MMKLFVISGPLYSGVTTAEEIFIDYGFLSFSMVDKSNIDEYLETFKKDPKKYEKVLLKVLPQKVLALLRYLLELKNKDFELHSIVLDAHSSVLLKRHETNPNPNFKGQDISDITHLEKHNIRDSQPFAACYIDTTFLKPQEFRSMIRAQIKGQEKDGLVVRIMSFGLKETKPLDLDLVLDARGLPNPYWDINLRHHNGLEKEIIDYLESFPVTKELMDKFADLISFILEHVEAKGKSGLYNIGICCTGGYHRSVYVAQHLYEILKEKYNVVVLHRELHRDIKY